MTEHPILFSGKMVKAILDGRKTQTRRVLKIQPFEEISRLHGPEIYEPAIEGKDGELEPGPSVFGVYDDWGEWGLKFPYGKIGDRLWVRETFTIFNDEFVYRADTTSDGEMVRKQYGVKWHPAIHMPRKASRITLEIVDVRVEKLHDISEIDCDKELGVELFSLGNSSYPKFRELWDSINAKKYPWVLDPWVWVIEFKVIQ